jgi:hypothetical protein
VNSPLLPPTPLIFNLLKLLTGARGFHDCANDAYCEDGNDKSTSQKSEN